MELASMGSVSINIHHHIITASGDVNRHSSSFKMAIVLNVWIKEVSCQLVLYG
jgi:hypothetical protein